MKPNQLQSGSNLSSTHLAFLDGLRGGAALWVLLAHCMIWGGWYGISLPDPKIAVEIFMILSGFLMTHLAFERTAQPAGENKTTANQFWLRRFFRIAPLYYLVLLFTFAFGEQYKTGFSTLQAASPAMWVDAKPVYIPANTEYSLTNFLLHGSFLFGFFPKFAQSTMLPDWSIGLEVQFYLAFPFLFYLFRRTGAFTAAVLIGMVGYGLKYLFAGLEFPEPSFLPLKINIFLIGMLVAAAVHTADDQADYRAVLVVFALCFSLPNSTYVSVTAALIFFMMAKGETVDPVVSWLRRFCDFFLSNPLARFMADTSYCVYLIHGFFVSFVGGWLYRQPDILLWKPFERVALLTGLTIAGSYGVGYILHRLVEKPGIKLGQRIINKSSTAKF